MGALNDSQIADFQNRRGLTLEMVGQYGLIVKDAGRLIDVFKVGDHLGFVEVPAAAMPSYTDMHEGDIRPLTPHKGTPGEITIAQITIGAIDNPVFDTGVLQSTVDGITTAAGNVAGAVGEGVGKGLQPAAQGIGKGLGSILTGLVSGLGGWIVVLGIGAGGYVYATKKGYL